MSDGSFSDVARLHIEARFQGACQRCGGRRGCQAHHRLPRRMGGTTRADLGSPANGVLLCHACHAWVESHRSCAYDLGLLLPAGAVPTEHPVWLLLPYGLGWYQLLDDGTVGWAHDLLEPQPACL